MKKLLAAIAILAVAASAQAQTNLIKNGSFENTTKMLYWNTSGDAGSAGSKALEKKTGAVNVPTTGQPSTNIAAQGVMNGIAGSRWCYQTVTGLTVGNTYAFSGWYAGGFGADLNVTGEVEWSIILGAGGMDWDKACAASDQNLWGKTVFKAFNDEIGEGVIDRTIISLNNQTGQQFGWKQATKTFVAKNTDLTVYLHYGNNINNYNVTSYTYFGAGFDALTLNDVTPVPEPSSVLALGTGLIGLTGFVIRRRK